MITSLEKKHGQLYIIGGQGHCSQKLEQIHDWLLQKLTANFSDNSLELRFEASAQPRNDRTAF